MKCIIYTRADGALAVVHPADAQREGETEGDWLARIAARSVPAGTPWRAIDTSELPADTGDADRAGWVDSGTSVTVDPTKAAAAALALLTKIRTEAAELLAATDRTARALRAVALTALDEINALRDWITQFKAATAAATSLANLQTRVAALANVPQRTAAQLKSALSAKAQAADSD